MSFDRGRNRTIENGVEREATLGDILGDALRHSENQKEINLAVRKEVSLTLSKMIECAASHYANNDRQSGDAIMNAVMYAQDRH